MTTLRVNGDTVVVPDGTTVADLVAASASPAQTRRMAVACNGDVVPRGTWAATTLNDGDAVEVLTAVPGG